MRYRKFCLASGVLSALLGCGDMKPDYISLGVGAREMRAKRGPIRFEENILFARAEVGKSLGNDWDTFLRGDFIQGRVGTEQYFVDGSYNGMAFSAGAGLRYFPFEGRYFSLDIGGEIFHAEGTVLGKSNGIRDSFTESVWVAGLDAGITSEVPFGSNVSWFGSAGWTLMQDFGGKGLDYNLSGPYLFTGLRFSIETD